jgi:hypothetical protein
MWKLGNLYTPVSQTLDSWTTFSRISPISRKITHVLFWNRQKFDLNNIPIRRALFPVPGLSRALFSMTRILCSVWKMIFPSIRRSFQKRTCVIFLDIGEILEKGVHESSVCDTGVYRFPNFHIFKQFPFQIPYNLDHFFQFSIIVTVCVFVRHLFSFYPFYFDFHSARNRWRTKTHTVTIIENWKKWCKL